MLATFAPTDQAAPVDLPTITLTRLNDPVVEQAGQAVTSRYVEVFWLPTLGPTALWLLRHASYHTAQRPYIVDIETLGKCLGVRGIGRNGPLMRSLQRLVDFDCAIGNGQDQWALRTHLGPLPARHLRRLPETLSAAHTAYLGARS